MRNCRRLFKEWWGYESTWAVNWQDMWGVSQGKHVMGLCTYIYSCAHVCALFYLCNGTNKCLLLIFSLIYYSLP